MLARYERNLSALSEKEVDYLATKTVAVVGCGGLGGYLIEYLGRLGIGSILAADGDRFEVSNLNRQLLCDTSNLGENKAEAAKKRMATVNPAVRFTALPIRIDAANGKELLNGADLIMDAVDGIAARFALEETAEALGIPLIHGAVAGWYGQVTTVYPGDRTMETVYRRENSATERNRGIEAQLGNLSFGPAFVAALQTAEAIKVLLCRGERLGRRLLVADLLENDFETIDLRRSNASGKEVNE
ncbi:MAG: HesA/MoeB/ThiF family protein [Treponemataceae bacterium]